MPALIPRDVGHTNGIIGFAFKDTKQLAIMLGGFCSLPFDFFIKLCGKGNLQMNTAGMLPLLDANHQLAPEVICRAARLNCVSENYALFWEEIYSPIFNKINWTKIDSRLSQQDFEMLSSNWNHRVAFRDAFTRRQAMVEIDVLIAMMLGMTLSQLLSAYRIQFPILQQHEKDTFYDAQGRIAFAKNNALTGVGETRQVFENVMLKMEKGQKHLQSIIDDTMPGGPVERTIEYVAPFDRCDREQDYETAWKFFEEKYKEG